MMRHVKFLFVTFVLALASVAMPAFAGSISVPLDQVRVVKFTKPVATVYVGNPAVADVNVIDSRRVFVLGKAFGATNIIALDAAGRQIADTPLTVYGRSANVVTLNRGSDQTTYSCAATRCEVTPVPGDEQKSYQQVMSENTLHQSLGQKAAAAAQ